MPLAVLGDPGTCVATAGSSKYRVSEHAHGFSIEGPHRPRVQVSCLPNFLAVDVASPLDGRLQRFGFYEFYRLNAAVAEGLMRDWQPPPRR